MQVYMLTGCASGIGRHLAACLLVRGDAVIATDVDLERLQEAAREENWPRERLELKALDVREAEAWEAAVEETLERFGRLDGLFNVAGVLFPNWIWDIQPNELELQLDINVKGVVLGTCRVARQMVAQGSGHIINIASMASQTPVPGMSLYSASKYAVRSFSVAAATELRPKGVFVSVVCPAVVKTPMYEKQLPEESAALSFSSGPLLTVEDIAKVVLGRVLKKRPVQVSIPRRMPWMVRCFDLFPGLALYLAPLFRKKGLRQQGKLRSQQKGS